MFSGCIDFDMYYFCNARGANTLTHIYIYIHMNFLDGSCTCDDVLIMLRKCSSCITCDPCVFVCLYAYVLFLNGSYTCECVLYAMRLLDTYVI